ncbi:Uncharacterized protein BM_BM17861 [Brugia malayi]|uniref:Uncharacterized protein n=1 Tax=Brugia malayi TaxID=6279 RepID=A0A4E9FS65_BRUMA|nr:Uncharacterized protein BM_BM17861 [Brugia malayi]VIO99607.1 Uncharacterized protein BM_BM17861 [Brugia malayi]
MDYSITLLDEDSADYTDYTMSDWQKNCVRVTRNGKQIIIGSSMRRRLMLLTALQLSERIAALIGVSSASDFTEDLIFYQLSESKKKN